MAEFMHHAYLIEGEKTLAREHLQRLFVEHKIQVVGNPDYQEHVFEAFLIEHAHLLRSLQQRMSMGDRKIFVVTFGTITSEAQNALLKTLEEPTEGTHFFFCTETAATLLPTVRSRMVHIHAGESLSVQQQGAAGHFLSADIPTRIAMIAPIIKEKDKVAARLFIDQVEQQVSAVFAHDPHYANAVDQVLHSKRYLLGRSPSVKILLEHLALALPVVSHRLAQ